MNVTIFLQTTGLTPLIKIRQIQGNTVIVDNAGMTELGDGIYNYDFTLFDRTKDYAVLIDKGLTFSEDERYYFGGNESFILEIAQEVKNQIIENWGGFGV